MKKNKCTKYYPKKYQTKETMDLYSPLANRLGLYNIKAELDDLSFKYLYPEDYRDIVEGIAKKKEERLTGS